VPALPSRLIEPLCDQFAALLPPREIFVFTHPWEERAGQPLTKSSSDVVHPDPGDRR
jgi:hypothetical protein